MQELRENLGRQIVDRRETVNDAYDRTYDRAARLKLILSSPAAEAAEREGLVAIAELKMRVGSDARALEREALVNNERVRKAQEDLAAASAKVTALRTDFDRNVREDAGIAKARQALEDARVARLVSETYFRGADLAAGEALDFAYFTHRYDYYRYNRHDDYLPHSRMRAQHHLDPNHALKPGARFTYMLGSKAGCGRSTGLQQPVHRSGVPE